MASQRFLQALFLTGALLSILGVALFFKQSPLVSLNPPLHLISQNVNDYLGPNQKVPGNPQLIRVQVLVGDDPSPQGVQIVEAEFNGKTISLKPRDIYGFRGQASFQTPPGKYKLKWTVRRDRFAWPRTTSHEEEVTLDPRDLWIQITIVGENASIS